MIASIPPAESPTLPLVRPLTVTSFGLTDPGQVRSHNEDQFLVAVLHKTLEVQQSSFSQPDTLESSDRSFLFVVADGLGGRKAGEEASAIAIDSVESFVLGAFKWFAKFKGTDQDQVLDDFQNALGQANARVLAEGARHPEWKGMGTTLTLAYSLNDVLFVAHVGDSRCYLRRNRRLFRLTRDHTFVEELVRRGDLTPDEAARHRLRHVVTNVVGSDTKDVAVEDHKVSLNAGDRLLLCSDGLTEMLSEQKISDELALDASPEQTCRHLIARANEAGGRDNITVVVADFGGIR